MCTVMSIRTTETQYINIYIYIYYVVVERYVSSSYKTLIVIDYADMSNDKHYIINVAENLRFPACSLTAQG